jgi:RimJ/RimL family protein N-acetyltransferase
MTMLEGFGRNVGLTKAMLTVFTENTGAIRFYKRIGYALLFSWFGRC